MRLDIWAAGRFTFLRSGRFREASKCLIQNTTCEMPNELFHLFIQSVVQPFQTAHRFCFAANVGRICVVFSHLWRVELILKLGHREMELWNWYHSYPTLRSWLTLSEVRVRKMLPLAARFAKYFRYLSLSTTMIAISGHLGVKAGSCSSEVLRWQGNYPLDSFMLQSTISRNQWAKAGVQLTRSESRRQMCMMQSFFVLRKDQDDSRYFQPI